MTTTPEQNRLWRLRNAERLRDYERGRNADANRAARWRAENPERAREISRRAYERRKLGAPRLSVRRDPEQCRRAARARWFGHVIPNNPIPGVRWKEHTPEQRRLYSRVKQREHRARRGLFSTRNNTPAMTILAEHKQALSKWLAAAPLL